MCKNTVKDVGFLKLAWLLLRISLGKSLGAALPALGKPRPSLFFYSD